MQPRHLEADLRADASAADQDAGTEASQRIYAKAKTADASAAQAIIRGTVPFSHWR